MGMDFGTAPQAHLAVWRAFTALTLASLVASGPQASAGSPGVRSDMRPAQTPQSNAVPRLSARTLRVYEAPEANQGVAADAQHFYPVDNSVLAKYDVASGQRLDRWDAPAPGVIRHLNSCLALDARIWCANSNYPATPMASSVEVFDAGTLEHVDSHSLGMTDEGSLTWFDRSGDGWIAGFAHYDGNGGLRYKDHSFSSVVTFDAEWRRTGGWLFPMSVMERMSPYAASGGAIGPDGWLYLLGHDRPEMYVVARPAMGPALVHLATIDLEAEGQAFSWAQDGSRAIYAIDRRKHLVRVIEIPKVIAAEPALVRPFR
jgi:hypothetical protein